jgi:hypothetical protein
LILIISDLFVPPDSLRNCFQHLRFRKHDVAVFHLFERHELEFDFDRPTRFVDLEGGAAILADPNIIANQYHRALQQYIDEMRIIMRDAVVDYHRVQIEEDYDQVLARFLLSRMPKGAK